MSAAPQQTTPIVLERNQPTRFYRGGESIAAFRGVSVRDGWEPEDWVGSTTTLFGRQCDGLTELPDGRLLRDAVAADPDGFLGTEHAARFGADPALLVKLLDAAQRLPVHCHPDGEFARRHLDCPYGKTEAWVVIDTVGADAAVYLGFAEPVDDTTMRRWVREQDSTLPRYLNRIPVSAGDAVLVPAGTPHAIGAGVFVIELQEATDLSVMLEWEGFALNGARDGHLGLGHERALDCVNRAVLDTEGLAALRTARSAVPRRPIEPVLPAAADAYFRAERVRPGASTAALDPSFAVLVVLAGEGELRTTAGHVTPLRRGMTVLVPHDAGESVVRGDCEVVRCRPPG